jgi:hypothetical protein
VSNSEGGFELVYQGSTTLLVAPLRLVPGERVRLRVAQRVTVHAERFRRDASANRAHQSTPDAARDVAPDPAPNHR